MEVRKFVISFSIVSFLFFGIPVSSQASFFNWGSCLRWRITESAGSSAPATLAISGYVYSIGVLTRSQRP